MNRTMPDSPKTADKKSESEESDSDQWVMSLAQLGALDTVPNPGVKDGPAVAEPIWARRHLGTDSPDKTAYVGLPWGPGYGEDDLPQVVGFGEDDLPQVVGFGEDDLPQGGAYDNIRRLSWADIGHI
jgi:hypothetical protein